MRTVGEDYNNILSNKGNFIRFGGLGIIDGLKNPPTKNECFEIIRSEPEDQHQVAGLILRKFGSKYYSLLPLHCFKQEFEIIGAKGFKKLPKY